MKRMLSNLWRSGIALLLVISLAFGNCGVAFAADTTGSSPAIPETNFNYVSIGDSMTNGYCFDGYEQGNGKAIDFLNGNGVYGKGAYPLQVEEWLENQGYTVNHTKLAPSAMRAEDLNYLLGGREMPDDGWYDEVNGYTEVYDNNTLSAFFQNAVTDADLITLCIGNASFGAYMLHRVTDALGLFGAELDKEEAVDLEMAITELDTETQEVILQMYSDLKAEMAAYIPAELAEKFHVDQICDIIAYTAAGFVLNYKGALERIVTLNPDAEIVLIGLMNTTYGMTITADGMDPIPVGDIMDGVFGALNAYVAGLPTAMQADGQWKDAKFYYAEQPNPLFISQTFAELKENGWENIDDGRLSGKIVRERNITAYNDSLLEMISAAFTTLLKNQTLPKISLDDVKNYEARNVNSLSILTQFSAAIYLGIEDAVAASTETMEIPLSGLVKIATDLEGVFADFTLTSNDLRKELGDYLTSTPELKGMCKIYALFKVGNGMSVHPTPSGHDNLAEAVIKAYREGYTAKDETINNAVAALSTLAALAAEYYDEAYAYAYAEAKAAGYIDAAANSIDEVIADLTSIDLSESQMTDAFKAEVYGEIEEIVESLSAAKALLLEADVLDEASLDALMAVLDEAGEAVANLVNVVNQAGADVTELVIIPALEDAKAKLENEVIPAVKAALEKLAKDVYAYLAESVPEALEKLAESIAEAAAKYFPELADAIYAYLYNNPEEVIAFVSEYGPYVIAALEEYGDEVLAVLGYVLYNYGDEIAAFVMENHETVLAAMADWAEVHGGNTIALIQVYAEALGLCDAVREQMTELENALEELKAEFAAKIAEVEAAVENLKAEMEKAMKNGLADLDAVKDAAEALADEVADLIAAVKDSAIDTVNEAIANVKAAAEALDAALSELLGDVYEELKGLANETLNAAAEAIVDAIEKYAPELADAIYDYLYNNPDEVIDFVKTYGPALFNLLEEYGDEALAVVGYTLYTYGEELAALMIENADEIMEGLMNWLEVHGENAAELLQVYAEALGLCDAVRDQIGELEAALEELRTALENASGEAKAAIEEKIAEIEAAIEELKAELEALQKAVIDAITEAVNDAKAAVDAVVEEIKAKMAEIEAEIEAKIAEIKAAVEELKTQIKAAVENAVDEIMAKAEEAVNDLENAAKELLAQVEALVDETVAAILAAWEKAVYEATHGKYTVDKDSFYVALGDGSAVSDSYVDLLAAELGLGERYENLAQDGLTVKDMLNTLSAYAESVARADLVTVGFNNNTLINYMVDQMFNYMMDKPVDTPDWTVYVGEEGVPYVEDALADIYAELIAQGLNIDLMGKSLADALMVAIENYAYAYVEEIASYPALISAIHEISPDALVVLVGMYNGLNGVVVEMDGKEIELGQYVQDLVDLANLESLLYAILVEDTVYVDAPEVETLAAAAGANKINLMQFILGGELVRDELFAALNPNANGHEYIFQQIMNALEVTYAVLLGDADGDGDVDMFDSSLVLEYYVGNELDYIDLNASDVDGDGDVDMFDSSLILDYYVGNITRFPAEN